MNAVTEPIAESGTREADIDSLAREIGIPPCPAILVRFSTEMHRDEPDVRKLAELIAGDVALSAALLKLVNSPFYGLRTKAANPQQALSVIGLRAAASLITGLILRQVFPVGGNATMQRFWDQSARDTSAAMLAARRIFGLDPAEAHTYALFRDCGIPVMIKKFDDYANILDRLKKTPGTQVVLQEQMAYQYSHAKIGYALARGWLLPESFSRAILYHHDFEKVIMGRREVGPCDRKLVAFGLLIDQISTLRAGGELCPDWESGERLVMTQLAISTDDIIALANSPDPDAE